jgi:DtxR family transcriptional regulator, Mn-dependent transcriptional regulator
VPAISPFRVSLLGATKSDSDSKLNWVEMPANVTEPLTEAMQHYLREVYKLEAAGTRATTTSVAEAMEVSAASASVMLKRLAALGLLEHVPYRGVALTDDGRRVALEVIRHHRLLEQYLAETLGVPLDQVHAEADRLEHALSEEVEKRIDALLGYPTHDPHGHPIPDAELRLAPGGAYRTIVSLAPGEAALVAFVPDGDADLLRYLNALGLVPGNAVRVVAQAPFGGPVTLRTDTGEHAISRELAESVGIA